MTKERRRIADMDLVPVFLVFWLISAFRVAVAIFTREVFGVEATLALLALVLLPWLLTPMVRALPARARSFFARHFHRPKRA